MIKFSRTGRGFYLSGIEINDKAYVAWYDRDGSLLDANRLINGNYYTVPDRQHRVLAKLSDLGKKYNIVENQPSPHFLRDAITDIENLIIERRNAESLESIFAAQKELVDSAIASLKKSILFLNSDEKALIHNGKHHLAYQALSKRYPGYTLDELIQTIDTFQETI